MPRLWPALLVTGQRAGVAALLRAVGCPRERRQEEGEGTTARDGHCGADGEPGEDEGEGESGRDAWMCALWQKEAPGIQGHGGGRGLPATSEASGSEILM